MDWLILIVGVPAVVVPIVLLYGFAGCGYEGVGTLVLPEKPTNLHATLALNRKGINLVWLPAGGAADSFEIFRTAVGEPNADFSSMQAKSDDTSSTLKPGVTFHYTVKAFKAGHSPPYSPTGPSKEAYATMPPVPPVLSGQFVGANLIRLNWTASLHATRYRLRHLPDLTVVYEGPQTTADHTVPPGPHDYEVVAIVGKDNNGVDKGFDDSLPKDVPSDPSATVQIAPPITLPNWVSIFTTANILPNPQNGVDVAGDCIVQRIPGPAVGGTMVRLKLRGIANQTTDLTAVTISRAVPSTAAQSQNSMDLPVPVTFGGASGVTFQNNLIPKDSDTIGYTVAAGQDLHIAFNVRLTSGRILRRNVPGALAYAKNNAAEAALAVRPPQYNTNNNDVYCIETIEVA